MPTISGRPYRKPKGSGGRPLSEAQRIRQVQCNTCDADPGERCKTRSGRYVSYVHASRRRRAERTGMINFSADPKFINGVRKAREERRGKEQPFWWRGKR